MAEIEETSATLEKEETPVDPEKELRERQIQLWAEKRTRVNNAISQILLKEKVRLVPIIQMRIDDLNGTTFTAQLDIVPDPRLMQ